MVHARVFGHHAVSKPEASAAPLGDPDPVAALVGRRRVRFDGAPCDAPVYDRGRLRPGHRIDGPAMVDEPSSTTALPPGCAATVDGYGNLILEVG